MSITQIRVFEGPQQVVSVAQSNPVRARNYSDTDGNPAGGYVHGPGLCVSFQDGPRGKQGDGELHPANGAFVEDLLVGALQRLEFFQASKFRHVRNQEAIDHIVSALEALNTRAAERKERGVLGANVV